MEAGTIASISPGILAATDGSMLGSLLRAAIDTLLVLSPLALVVLLLLLPFVYRVIFLRARVDKRSYAQGRSRPAPIIRKLRKRFNFNARHWDEYIALPGRNLRYRVEVAFLYDLAKAAAAYYASGQWQGHMRRLGVVHPVFIDEDQTLGENLERNGFFLSPFFEEGVANRYLMRRTADGHVAARVQTDRELRTRAVNLFKEALREAEPQYEQGHIYLPFLTMTRWERIRFRIHTMIITKILSDGMQKGIALALSYGLFFLLKGEEVGRGAVGFLMELAALLFMTHVFDTVLKKRYSQYQTDWEDRERYYYRRQMHQFIIGLDPAAAREQARKDRENLQLLRARSHHPRELRRIYQTLKRVSRDPQEPARVLGAALDVLDYAHEDSAPIALVLLKELAAAYPRAYAGLLTRWRKRNHPWAALDGLVRTLLDDGHFKVVAAAKGIELPDKLNLPEWERAVSTFHNEFPAEVDRAKVQGLATALDSPAWTPGQRQTLVTTHFLGGLLWRLRSVDAADPLARAKDARIYHATAAFTLPVLGEIHARQKRGACDYGLQLHEIGSLIGRIRAELPRPAGHKLRRSMATDPDVLPALAEIQPALAVKRLPASSEPPALAATRLRAWLDASARDTPTLGVLARALHAAYRKALGARIELPAQRGTDGLLLDPRVLDSQFNPGGAERLQASLARAGVDGAPNEAVLAYLGFLGARDTPAAALGETPIHLTLLDLKPVVDCLRSPAADDELLAEATHQALVDFYQAGRMAANLRDLPDALIRPAEGDDTGGAIAKQLAVIRLLRAKLQQDPESAFLVRQEAVHLLEVIVNPLHASSEHLLGQAERLGPELLAATRTNLHRLQDAGRALLVPLCRLADQPGLFGLELEAHWSAHESGMDMANFLAQFQVRGRQHAEAITRARLLLHHYEALRGLIPAYPAGPRTAWGSFNAAAADAGLVRIAAGVVTTMIDQSGLATREEFRAVQEVLADAAARQGFCNRGNLSDLMRVTPKQRDAFGQTRILGRFDL